MAKKDAAKDKAEKATKDKGRVKMAAMRVGVVEKKRKENDKGKWK